MRYGTRCASAAFILRAAIRQRRVMRYQSARFHDRPMRNIPRCVIAASTLRSKQCCHAARHGAQLTFATGAMRCCQAVVARHYPLSRDSETDAAACRAGCQRYSLAHAAETHRLLASAAAMLTPARVNGAQREKPGASGALLRAMALNNTPARCCCHMRGRDHIRDALFSHAAATATMYAA